MKNRFIKWTAASLLAAGCTYSAFAQEPADALRFSMLQPQGTARSIGFGNALGSIGGDFSSLSVNPAGIGIYRKGEFMFTPSLMFNNTDSRPNNAGGFSGNSRSDNGQHFSISNLGFVFTNSRHGREYDRSGWKAGSFAIGVNRLADFTRDYSYSGTNTSTSASWVFEDDLTRNPDYKYPGNEGSLGSLGYQSYLLDTATLSNGQSAYRSVVNPSESSPIRQRTNVRERGGISEFLMSFGGNYKEKLMLGGTIGIPYVRYIREATIEETDLSGNPDNNFDYFTYSDRLRRNGIGINAKLGFIYKPIDYFRIGGAIHTPTYYGFHDYTEAGIVANTENFGGYRDVSGDREYDYNLTTPWRAVASATALFGKYGFVTFDYEYVDYASSRFRLNDDRNIDLERSINDGIKDSYRAASNLRAGVELRFDFLSLRGGIGYYGDPYKKSMENYVNGERWDYSAGVGFRTGHTFIDLGFIHHQYKSVDQPYVVPYSNFISPTANQNNTQNNAVVTVGWKF